ncbi:hypothetical protein J5N97_014767 [Dioscorea zingiberensis]|uniref:Uncharacterized protein n=1 Tax=Dioscorea zingiberensis TaxID=325984 RepID=A0A9D5HK31_9LILI|nr:hypothetical protein J5N97_014767 [Dioscorea zingiberensis]
MEATSNGHLHDSDADSDGSGDDAYYHPISADSDDGEDLENEHSSNSLPSNVHDPNSGYLNGTATPNPNPPNLLHCYAENGVADLDLNGGEGGSEEEEEMEKEREASISRAFREDESRRNAPLTAENSARVLEAMRGVAFPGVAPDWAGEVPEERWVDQLRRLQGNGFV